MFKHRTLARAVILGMLTCSAGICNLAANAAPVVLNGSFQNAMSPGIVGGSPNFEIPTGPQNFLPNWTTTGTSTFSSFLDCLIFGNQSAAVHACGGPAAFKLWKDPGLSPDGGNYIAFDGDPIAAHSIAQVLTGLVPGQFYAISFFQAAGQLSDRTGKTEERWEVSLIGSAITEVHLSDLMKNASQDIVPWNAQKLTFQAHDATATLKFFAVGTPAGLPPFVLLDGVSIAQVPEPATWGLVSLALLGIWGARLQSRPRA